MMLTIKYTGSISSMAKGQKTGAPVAVSDCLQELNSWTFGPSIACMLSIANNSTQKQVPINGFMARSPSYCSLLLLSYFIFPIFSRLYLSYGLDTAAFHLVPSKSYWISFLKWLDFLFLYL